MKKAASIFIPVFICLLVGWLASYFQAESIRSWYPFLNKSAWTPPNAIFPVAWGIIYVCMGVSAGLVFLSDAKNRNFLLALFAVQLFFNFIWSLLFFYYRSPLLGFADILLLDILVSIYTVKSYKASKTAAFLFIPYMAWIYFASYLNGYILICN